MRKVIVLLFAFLLSVAAMAVPARRGTFTVTQSDGTVITLRLMGDEYFHYFQNVATGEKMLQGSDGDFYVVAESELSNRSKKAQTRRAAANAARAKRLPKHVVSTDGRKKVGTINSVTGQKKGLVILVNFSDKSMASGHNQSAFDNMFNQVGYNQNGHIGSVHDYFNDQSYGKLNLTFDVVGPVTVSKSMSYYGGNDSNDNDMYPATMVIEACRLVNSQVNFADYDWDGDGEVEQVYVIYAGYAESQGASDDTIWPHQWKLSDAENYNDGTGALTLDGVKIDTYACSSELSGTSGTTLSGIGTACHEFSHCLGFPDFYDTSSEGSGVGMSYFDVLDGGSYNGPNGDGEVPCGYTAYERYEAGWLDPEFLDDYSEVENMPALTDEARAYILFNGDDTDDYVLIENRQSKSWFRYFNDETAGHGLFVTHVQYDKEAWESNEVNTNASNQRMTWIPADGSRNESTHTADFYPGTGSEDSFYCFNHSLTHISENSEKISFVIDERYTVTFDPGTGTCGTTSLTQSEYLEAINLPKCTPPDGWSFKGWSTEVVNSTTSDPSLVYSPYPPTGNVTLYAVYSNSTSGTGSSNTFEYVTAINSGSDYVFVTKNTAGDAYMLDSSKLSQTSKTSVTATSVTVSANGEKLVIENPSSSAIWTLSGSNSNSNLKAKNGSYYLKINGSGAALSETESSVYWNGNTGLYGKSGSGSTSYYTQYSTSNNATNFTFSSNSGNSNNRVYLYKRAGSSSSTTYATYPNGEGLAKPVITFPSSTRSMFVGDVDDTFTATVSNSTGAISYDSSNPLVATVGPETGRVVAKETGTTKITATVAAVSGVSISSKASYTLTVSMPELVSITVTTPPTKTTYMEGEKFSTEGIVVTASYANGYKEDITTSCQYSISSTTSLTTDITCITISFTEKYGDHDITVTTTQPIAVTPLPKYKVTFNAGSGTCSTTSLSESEYQGGVVLPSATSVSDEWAFAGWSIASVNATSTRPTLYAPGSTYKPASDITLYAVYSLSETSGGSGNYELVTEKLSDWSGDYLIAAADNIFADGRVGGKDANNAIGAQKTAVDPGSNLSGTTVAAEWGDTYHVTLEAITGGYALKTQDGVYNYRTTNSNGLDTSDNADGINAISVTFNSEKDIDLTSVVSSKSKPVFHYNNNNNSTAGGWFRFYQSGGQSNIYLYKKQGSLVSVTYNSNPTGTALVVPTVKFSLITTRMYVGEKTTNKATVTNSTGTVHYSSSDTKVATVNETTGEVTAIGVGTVTITAFVDAVAGVSKSASTTYTITVTMPVLTGLAIATEATKIAFQEGEAFTSAGLSLTATYRNGYTQILTKGFVTSPEEGEALAVGTNSVTVSYTEGSVTKTVSYAITVAELPKYAVHFMSNGRLVETITETIANNGVVAPQMNDVTLTVDGEKLTYEFVGWTKTNAAKEGTSKPTVLTLTDGKYKPTAETTLYALYKCTTGNFAKGFKLSLTFDKTTYYVGDANNDNKRFEVALNDDGATTLYYDNGKLWYMNNSTATYVCNNSSESDVTFTTKKSEASVWDMSTENDGTVRFMVPDTNPSRYLALNLAVSGGAKMFRTYTDSQKISYAGSVYPYPSYFYATYTGETSSVGSTTTYTCYPEINIVTIANMIDCLKKKVKGYTEDDITNATDKVLKK